METPKENELPKTQINFEKQQSPIHFSIRGISVHDSNVVWLSGAKGSILRTIDGGNKWELLPPPDTDSLDFRDVEAFSKTNAVVVSAGFPARIYYTSSAGEKWQLVYENTDSAAFLNSVTFKNELEGIVFGDQLNGRHLILRTQDGGKTWLQIDTLNIPKPLKIENGFAASGSCIAVNEKGKYFIGLGGEKSRVFSSKNGLDWIATEAPMISGTNSTGIYSIAAANKIIMAVGGDYTIPDSGNAAIKSMDYGRNWIQTKGKLNGYRSVVDYSTYGNCWLSAGTNGVDVSYDDGTRWQKLNDLNINTLQFTANGKVGFAANSLGEIFKIRIFKD